MSHVRLLFGLLHEPMAGVCHAIVPQREFSCKANSYMITGRMAGHWCLKILVFQCSRCDESRACSMMAASLHLSLSLSAGPLISRVQEYGEKEA